MKDHLTPLEVMMLIHYFYIYEDFKHIDSPAQRDAIEKFVRLELIKENVQINDEDPKYVGNTEALQPYIEKLCSVPLPTKKWVVSESKSTEGN